MDKQKLNDEIVAAEAHLVEMKRQLAESDKPGVERCAIRRGLHTRALCFNRNNSVFGLRHAMDFPDFAGYEYEDGLVSAHPVVWTDDQGTYWVQATIGRRSVRPVAVLFAKQGV